MTDIPELQHLLIEAADRRRGRRRVAVAARGLALAAALVLAVLLVPRIAAQDREVEVPGTTATATATAAPTVTSKPKTVEEAFAVFRRPAGKQDHTTMRLPEVKGGEVRRIASTPTIEVFLAWGGKQMCLVTQAIGHRGGSTGCGRTSVYLDGHHPTGSYSDDKGKSTIAFAFPDGVSEVTVTLENGDRDTYPVANNGFARDVPERPARLEWVAPDGKPDSISFTAAPAFAAKDFYSALQRPPAAGDKLGGLPGSRLVLRSDAAKAWLVPRLGAVCLVVQVQGDPSRGSGCRHKVADVRRPLIVALPGPGGGRVVVAAFPNGAKNFALSPTAGVAGKTDNAGVLAFTDGGEARTLRYISPARNRFSDKLPAGTGGFVLNARAEPPETLTKP